MPTPKETPLWRKYLDGLPNAEDSHPECLVKGSVLRAILGSSPRQAKPDFSILPAAVRELVETPPLPTVWLSEVRFHVLMLAYQDAIPQREFDDWVYDRNKKLLASPLYRILFLVVSPERLFIGVPHRWAAFRRGSSLELLSSRGGHAKLALTYPKNLHDEVTLGNLTVALQTAAEAAGAKDVQVRLSSVSSVRAVIEAKWR